MSFLILDNQEVVLALETPERCRPTPKCSENIPAIPETPMAKFPALGQPRNTEPIWAKQDPSKVSKDKRRK